MRARAKMIGLGSSVYYRVHLAKALCMSVHSAYSRAAGMMGGDMIVMVKCRLGGEEAGNMLLRRTRRSYP